MDAEQLQHIKDQLFNKKTKDYSNLTFFFLIFSVFAFFVIRPSLTTAFSLQTKEGALKQTESQYEDIVSRIPGIQQVLEQIRPDQHVITDTLPTIPNINSMLQDIERGGQQANISINRMTVNDVDLVGKPQPALKHMIVELEAVSTYNNFVAFQRILHRQKRLKMVKSFEIVKDVSVASISGTLKVKMEVEGYYL